MLPEIYFIKYAFPCSHILCTVRGEITSDQFKEMENSAIENKPLDRDFLEKTFFRAFNRISKLADEMKKDKWDIDVIKEYFRVIHNPVLDKSDYPDLFKEMCKVFEGKVVEEKDGDVVVEYENQGLKKRKVKKDYIPDLKIGDFVTIHWQYAIEKIPQINF